MSRSAVHTDRVPVTLAAFGTLSNGSDVRLLASPDDGSLSSEARAAIESLFYKAWRGSRRRMSPYFAFLPLDHDAAGQAANWGLMRVSHLGSASMGAVVVVWVAIISTQALDAIGWQTHRLWSSALPEPRLPEPGELTSRRVCELGAAWSESLDPYLEDFERAAFALCGDAGPPRQVSARVLIEPPVHAQQQPLTPEGALFGIWSQLGHWCADLSYCTWGEIDDGSTGDGTAFNILVGPSAAKDLGRRLIPLGAADEGAGLAEPSPGWLMVRQMETGISSARELLELREDQAVELAGELFDWARESLVQGTYSPLERLLEASLRPEGSAAGDSRMLRGSLPRVLRHALGQLPEPTKSGILEYYIRSLLPRLKASPSDPNPAHTVARLALDHRAVVSLSSESLAALGPALFDMPPGEHDLLQRLLAAVRLTPPDKVNWTGLLSLALSDRATDPERLDEALVDLIAGGWGFSEHRPAAEEGLAQFVDDKDPVAALAIVGAAAAESRRGLFAAIAARRVKARPSRGRRDPARPRAVVASLRLLNAGAALERDVRGHAK